MKDRKWSKPIKGEWASALQAYISTQAESVPPGWKTTPQTLNAMGLKYLRGGSRSMMLNDMVENGILEKRRFKILDISGRRILPVDHYRLAKKSSPTK
jgi:hypothetical protein